MGTISNPRAVYSLLATGTPTKTQSSGDVLVGVGQTTLNLTGATKAYCVSATLASNADTLTINTETGVATVGTTPVAQVETATVVAAGGATSNGNLAVTVTAARIAGSPLAISVALNTVSHTTATLIAAAIRAAFNATAALTAVYTVGGTGANVTLTETSAENNDATLNIAIAAGLGVSAITNSTNSTAGVGGVKLTNNTGDGKDFEGISLGTLGVYFGMLIKNAATSGSSVSVDWGNATNMAVYAGSGVLMFGSSAIDGSGNMVITHDGGTGTVSLEITFVGEPA